jgi:magnesium transporter
MQRTVGDGMITIYDSADGTLVKRTAGVLTGPAPVWIDLLHPTKDEELGVEKMFSLSIPTKDEMQEIETSSRLYHEGAAHYMTATLLRQKDDDPATRTNVTFILVEKTLITVRYEEPRAFGIFVARAQKKDATCDTGCSVLVGLLEAIIDREADRIERITGEVDKLGQSIFTPKGGKGSRSKRFEATIKTVGLQGEIASRARECLLSLDRMLTFIAHVAGERGEDKSLRARLKTVSRDINSLELHVDAVSQKVQFLLDATLGLISIEQNNIIKIFSVASVALMPPTLIASIYGMNFKHMPELDSVYGYPIALFGMLLSAVIPFVYFKRKGWY